MIETHYIHAQKYHNWISKIAYLSRLEALSWTHVAGGNGSYKWFLDLHIHAVAHTPSYTHIHKINTHNKIILSC